MAAVKFLALIIFGLRGLISSSKLQMNTRFTDATGLCPTLLGFLIKPTCVPLGLEALLSAVLRNRSAILDSTSQSSRPRTKALKLFVYCMLLLSGDISLNPGPSGSSNCEICNKSVRANQKGIQCDSCDLWLHTSCCSIDDPTYYHLANSSCTWVCPHCDQPSFSCSSVFSSPSVSLNSENSFLALSRDLSDHQQPDIPPVSSSTPSKNAANNCRHRSTLRCMEINCNSIRSSERSAVFASHIDNINPDIVFGCESKLSPDDPTYSCFPSTFTVFRKDRLGCGGGGVFIAVKSDIPAYELPDLAENPENESIWASIHLAKAKVLYICAFYKPPSAPSSRIDSLSESMLKVFDINKKTHPNIVISGDFNCGDIDWKCDPPMVTSHSTAPLMHRLLDFIGDHALTQYVTVPTRSASLKTLDLVLSSVPSLVSDIQIKPGMSDHDIVLFNIRVKPKRSSRPPHKVYLYDKADLETFRQDVSNTVTEFFAHCLDRSLEENWAFFKDTLTKAVDKHIPSKMTKAKSSLPWISRAIKRQMRRRDHLHKKARRSSDKTSPAWSAYRHQRNKVVKLLKTSHNRYLNQEIGGSLKDNPKRFWSYIKHSRTENMGIPTLRQGDSIFISAKDKADLLNKHFESVFTRDNGSLPTSTSTSTYCANFLNIGDILFDESGVQKLLANLNVSKSSGPDGISPRCLQVLSARIYLVFCHLFFNRVSAWVPFRVTGLKPWLYQFTKNRTRIIQQITDQYPLHAWPVNLWNILCSVISTRTCLPMVFYLLYNMVFVQACPVKRSWC